MITAEAYKFSIYDPCHEFENFELILRNKSFDKMRGWDQISATNFASAREFAVFCQTNGTLEISSLHSLMTHAKARFCLSIKRKPNLNKFSSRIYFKPFGRVTIFSHNIFKIPFIHDCFVKSTSFFCYNLGKKCLNWRNLSKIPKKHG